VNNELGGMVRKAVVTDFKEIFQHFPWEAEENHGKPQSG
jgi:2-oxo-4-hydroxy-4-carboxy--5-ureidoimidazoline (OHCU) decarboxylase